MSSLNNTEILWKIGQCDWRYRRRRNAAKNNTDDADENAEVNERIHKYKGGFVTIEEETKTLGYRETMNLDVENITSKSQQI